MTGKPSLIYPVGYRQGHRCATSPTRYGIVKEAEHFCEKHKVAIDTPVRIPGSLMSYRDPHAMLECLFYVNELPGGEAHHDGGMKGRDHAAVLANPMLQLARGRTGRARSPAAAAEADGRFNGAAANADRRTWCCRSADVAGDRVAGHRQVGHARVPARRPRTPRSRRNIPSQCFFVSCDLNPSTSSARPPRSCRPVTRFEMSIQEQAAALMTDGLSLAADQPQLNVFATFAAFMEGIAREGFEFWRYQRNLNGSNEGLNVVMHFSHVGACTGRDHFSGWSLDWVNLALGYLPFLHRFYAPADARSAFIAVRDAAAHFGGHIVAIPRDTLPVLTQAGQQRPAVAGR